MAKKTEIKAVAVVNQAVTVVPTPQQAQASLMARAGQIINLLADALRERGHEVATHTHETYAGIVRINKHDVSIHFEIAGQYITNTQKLVLHQAQRAKGRIHPRPLARGHNRDGGALAQQCS